MDYPQRTLLGRRIDRGAQTHPNRVAANGNARFETLGEPGLSSMLLSYLGQKDVIALLCVSKQTHALGTQMAWRELLARDFQGFVSASPACPCGETCASDGTSLLRCSHCKASWYCSRSCQMADRSSHKRWCLQPPSLRARTQYMTLFTSKCAGCHTCLRAPFHPEPWARPCSNCFKPVCAECHCPCTCTCCFQPTETSSSRGSISCSDCHATVCATCTRTDAVYDGIRNCMTCQQYFCRFDCVGGSQGFYLCEECDGEFCNDCEANFHCDACEEHFCMDCKENFECNECLETSCYGANIHAHTNTNANTHVHKHTHMHTLSRKSKHIQTP
jgi:hypothetical protein